MSLQPYAHTVEELKRGGVNKFGIVLYWAGVLRVQPRGDGICADSARRWHPLFWLTLLVVAVGCVPVGTYQAWKKYLLETWRDSR